MENSNNNVAEKNISKPIGSKIRITQVKHSVQVIFKENDSIPSFISNEQQENIFWGFT